MTRFRRWLGRNLIALGRRLIFGRPLPPLEIGERLGADFEAVWDANVDKLHES